MNTGCQENKPGRKRGKKEDYSALAKQSKNKPDFTSQFDARRP